MEASKSLTATVMPSAEPSTAVMPASKPSTNISLSVDSSTTTMLSNESSTTLVPLTESSTAVMTSTDGTSTSEDTETEDVKPQSFAHTAPSLLSLLPTDDATEQAPPSTLQQMLDSKLRKSWSDLRVDDTASEVLVSCAVTTAFSPRDDPSSSSSGDMIRSGASAMDEGKDTDTAATVRQYFTDLLDETKEDIDAGASISSDTIKDVETIDNVRQNQMPDISSLLTGDEPEEGDGITYVPSDTGMVTEEGSCIADILFNIGTDAGTILEPTHDGIREIDPSKRRSTDEIETVDNDAKVAVVEAMSAADVASEDDFLSVTGTDLASRSVDDFLSTTDLLDPSSPNSTPR